MKKTMKYKKYIKYIAAIILTIGVWVCRQHELPLPSLPWQSSYASVDEVPDYTGTSYVEVNGNVPFFTEEEITKESFEKYGTQDALGRCTEALACLGRETMPKEGEERGKIGNIKPSGWHSVRYDCVEGKYLYNRAHLIGWQLGAENDNEKNLVTGTRYMNTEMVYHENMVAEYIKETGNHVMYRVTPVFSNRELLCRGVLMEAYSVEDTGKGIEFCVYYYNVQPGVEIDYMTGESRLCD